MKQRGGEEDTSFSPPTRNSSFLLEVEEENSFFVGGQFVWHFCDDMSRTRKNKRDKYLFSSMTHFLYSRNRKESNLKKKKKKITLPISKLDATDTSSKNKRESNLSSYYVKSFYTPRSKLALKIRQEKNKESNEMEK